MNKAETMNTLTFYALLRTDLVRDYDRIGNKHEEFFR